MSTHLPGSGGDLSLVAPGDQGSLHASACGLRELAHALRGAHQTQLALGCPVVPASPRLAHAS